MTYRVPPKQTVFFKGRLYGAGDHVPGYKPPVKTSKKTTKKSAKAEVAPEVTEEPEVVADTTPLTGEE